MQVCGEVYGCVCGGESVCNVRVVVVGVGAGLYSIFLLNEKNVGLRSVCAKV